MCWQLNLVVEGSPRWYGFEGVNVSQRAEARLYGRGGVSEENPGEAIGERAAQFHKRHQHLGDDGTMG